MIFTIGNYCFRVAYGVLNVGLGRLVKDKKAWYDGTAPSKEFMEFDRLLRTHKPAYIYIVTVMTTRLLMTGMRALLTPKKNGETVTIAGVRCLLVRRHEKHKRMVIHIHGGGFMSGQPECYTPYLNELSDSLDATVVSIDYRLAPEHKMPAGKYDCLRVYNHIVDIDGVDPKNISITGDSAGGGMVLLVLQSIVKHGGKVPSSAVLLSPWTDVTMSPTEFYRDNEHKDCILNTEMMHYVASIVSNGVESNPTYSSLYGSFEGLPPLYFIVGSHEILLDDSLRAAKKAEKAGVATKLWIARNMCHVFPCFPGLFPEARYAIGRITHFIEHHVGGGD